MRSLSFAAVGVLVLAGCGAEPPAPATAATVASQKPVEVVAVELPPPPAPSAEPSAKPAADEPPVEAEDEESEAADAVQYGILGALQGTDGDAAFGVLSGDTMSGGVVGGLGLGGGGSAAGGIGWGTVGTGGLGSAGGGFGGTGRSAPTPKLAVGAPQSIGALPPEVIRRIVRGHSAKLRYCYEKALLKSPKLEGKIGVRFVIGKDGAVAAATSQGSTLPSPEVVQCVLGVFRAMAFPQPNGGIVTVNYPLLFQPSDAAAPSSPAPSPAPKKKP